MKKAIDYLKTLGIKCDKFGNVLSKIPNGIEGIELINMLEENTENEDESYCYTIVNNIITKIDI